jgi:hypothetical protein
VVLRGNRFSFLWRGPCNGDPNTPTLAGFGWPLKNSDSIPSKTIALKARQKQWAIKCDCGWNLCSGLDEMFTCGGCNENARRHGRFRTVYTHGRPVSLWIYI